MAGPSYSSKLLSPSRLVFMTTLRGGNRSSSEPGRPRLIEVHQIAHVNSAKKCSECAGLPLPAGSSPTERMGKGPISPLLLLLRLFYEYLDINLAFIPSKRPLSGDMASSHGIIQLLP